MHPQTSKPLSPNSHGIPVIGIIGGIGSGKSTVARWAANHANLAVLDADQMGHQALKLQPVKAALGQRFGQSIFDESGEVNRSALAKMVFGNSDVSRLARRDLEQIVHPAIEEQVVDAINKAVTDGREAVLLDAAVLLEADWQKRCNAVVFVDVSDEVRYRRVAARSGWSLDELHKRESSQLDLSEKRRRSDVVISNETDDSQGGQELLAFLCRTWGLGCKPLSNPSKQS